MTNGLSTSDPRLVQPTHRLARDGSIGLQTIPVFEFEQKFDVKNATGAGSLANQTFPYTAISLRVTPELFFRRLYLAHVFSDVSATAFEAVLDFKLYGATVARWPLRRNTLGEEMFSHAFTTRKAIQAFDVEYIDDIETEAHPDALMWHNLTSDVSNNKHLLVTTVNPFRLTVSCDSVQLIVRKFTATAVSGSGLAALGLGMYSQNLPL